MDIGIGYLRKSTFIRGMSEEDAIGYQMGPINDYCERNNIKLIKSFIDVGYSGKNVDRPRLQEMLKYVKENEISNLIIYSIDRFGRDLSNNIGTVLEISNYVKKISFVVDGISSDNEYFKTLFLIKTAAAQEERENLIMRVAKGRDYKIKHGKKFHNNYTPLGMIVKKDVDRRNEDYGRLLPATYKNTDNLKEILGLVELKFIFMAYLFGLSLGQVAKHLNNHFGKTRRGKIWSKKAVAYVLNNPVYKGVLQGTLTKYDNYLIDDANIVNLIDPFVYNFLQHKLSTGKFVNKKKYRLSIPQLLVCKKCLIPMEYDDRKWTCGECKAVVDSPDIEAVIKEELLSLIKNNIDIKKAKKITKEKELSLMHRCKTISAEIDKLEQRRTLIEKLSEDDPKTMKTLIEYNSYELAEKAEEYERREMSYKFVESINKSKVIDTSEEELKLVILGLPFIIFVDIESFEIEIIFHKKIFNEVL